MNFRHWDRNLKIRLYILIVYGMMYWMFYPFMLMFFQSSVEKWLLGILMSVSAIFSAFVSFFSGYLADTYGRKKMMTIGQLLQGVGLLWMALSFPIGNALNLSPFQLAMLVFTGFTIIGVSGSLYYPASNAMITDVVPEEHRSKIFAIFYTFINFNVSVGPLIGSLFVDKYLFEFLLVTAIVTLYLTYITGTKFRETLDLTKIIRQDLKQVIQNQIKNYQLIFKDSIFLMFMIFTLLSGLAFSQFFSLVPIAINETFVGFRLFNYHLSHANVYAISVFQNGLMVVLLSYVTNVIMEKFPRKIAFMVSSFFYSIAMFFYGYASGLTNPFMFFLIGNTLATLGEVSTVGANTTFLVNLAPKDKKATYFAASDLFNALWRAVFPLVITFAGILGNLLGSNRLGNRYTFFLLGILVFMGIFLAHHMVKKYEERNIENVKKFKNHEIN